MGTIHETLKNQVIDAVEETYLKELKKSYTRFVGVICHDLLKHLLNQYRKIMTADLKSNNQQMNNPIE